MPVGGTYLLGETPVLPGVYFRVTKSGESQPATVQGTVLALFRSTRGDLNVVRQVDSLARITEIYGTGDGPDTAKEALRGGALRLKCLRVGTGGTKATETLVDTTGSPVNAVRLDARTVGVQDLSFILRDTLYAPTTKRELVIYLDDVEVERFAFPKASGDEAQGLVDAVAAANDGNGAEYITATFLATGSGVLAAVASPNNFTAGTGVTVDAGAFNTALALVELEAFNVLVTDSEDSSIHANLLQWAIDLEDNGRRRFVAIGEPTTVALATRQANAAANNRWNILYVGGGFTRTDGTVVEGAQAAGQVAGRVARGGIENSITNQVIEGGLSVYAPLALDELEASIENGMIAFVPNEAGQVTILSGVTTFITTDANRDTELWGSVLPVARMFELMNRVAVSWGTLVGRVNNNASGRGIALQAGRKVIADLIAAEALESGTVYVDPARTPTGRTAWFVFEVAVLNKIEKFLAEFRFEAA